MKFWQRRRQERLYKQWAKHAGLPPEAMPASEMPADMKIGVDIKTRVETESWFYRFRVRILDIVRKILGVE